MAASPEALFSLGGEEEAVAVVPDLALEHLEDLLLGLLVQEATLLLLLLLFVFDDKLFVFLHERMFHLDSKNIISF